MELYSDLGKEYAKPYSKHALQQIADWAVKAEEGLRDKAESKRKENNTTGDYVEDDDANLYSDLATTLYAIIAVL